MRYHIKPDLTGTYKLCNILDSGEERRGLAQFITEFADFSPFDPVSVEQIKSRFHVSQIGSISARITFEKSCSMRVA
jgi:hypothetical protein